MKTRILTFPLMLTALAWCQPPQAPPAPQPAAPPPAQQPGPPQAPGAPQPRPARRLVNAPLVVRPRPAREPLEAGPRGRWWTNPETAKAIGLTADQQKKMDDIFQQHRLALIDLNANVEKQEVILEPLVSADQPDESKVLAQIDRVAQARAELEKANARMLLDIRRVMTAEQWQKLKAIEPAPQGIGRRGGGVGPAPGPGR